MKSKFFLLLFCLGLSLTSFSEGTFYFVFLNTNPDKDVISEDSAQYLQNAHLKNIERLYNMGKIVAAGPFAEKGGIYVFEVDTEEEVWEHLATDEGIQAKRWKLEVFPFDMQFGTICKIPEQYEMATYSFIRYIPRRGTNTKKTMLNKERIRFLSEYKNNIVVQGTFGADKGGILLLDGLLTDSVKTILSKDPAIVSGLNTYTIRNLWIAEGTWCKESRE